MYDFHKTKQVGKEQEYKHDLFKRGKKFIRVELVFNFIGNFCRGLKGRKTTLPRTNIAMAQITGGPTLAARELGLVKGM